MAAVSVSRRRGVRRLDPYAAAWGGVIGAVALMVGSGLGLVTRFVIIGVTFVVAGAAAGLRALADRQLNATGAWATAHVLAVAFVVLSGLITVLVGPDGPPLFPGGFTTTLTAAVLALFAALLGAVMTNRWLTPRGSGNYGSKLR